MFIRRLSKKKALLVFGDLAIILFIQFCFRLIDSELFEVNFSYELVSSIIVVSGIFLMFFYFGDIYEIDDPFTGAKYLFRYFRSLLFIIAVLALLAYVFSSLEIGYGASLKRILLISFYLLIWRFFLQWSLKRFLTKKKNVLIVGAGILGEATTQMLVGNLEFNVVGFIDDDSTKVNEVHSIKILGSSEILMDCVRYHNVDILVLAIGSSIQPELLKRVLVAKMTGVHVTDMPHLYEEVTGKLPIKYVNDTWFVDAQITGVKRTVYNFRIKRTLDLILSISLAVITLPFSLFIVLAIKMTSSGPALFKQKRVGLNGKTFVLYKFRTMKVNTEHKREYAGEKKDPRITPFGVYLRTTRFDEIPQVLNVFRGEMSFIGPRALIEEEVQEFNEAIPYFALRHSIRPGITGWAQVNYPHGVRVEDGLAKLQYDLFYIKNLSPLVDFHILLKTMKVVLLSKGSA